MLCQSRIEELNSLCVTFRKDVIKTLYEIQTGHPGGSLSVCEILTALYYEKAAVFPNEPDNPSRDRIILSKGHAAPMLYRVLAGKGYFPLEEMNTLRRFGSRLQGHPCSKNTPGVELSTGPLGLGLPAAVGIALSLRLDGNKAKVYAVLGDGELNEGSVWEAALIASKYNLCNLTAIIDRNGVQLDGACRDILPTEPLADKWRAFGWQTLTCDGHDIAGIYSALEQASGGDLPCVVIAETVKGRGVSFMEGNSAWHGGQINAEQFTQAMRELGGDRKDD